MKFQIDKIGLNCDTNSSDKGYILFLTKVNNRTSKSINIYDPDNFNGNIATSFILISDQIHDHTINLKVSNGDYGKSINKNEIKDIWVKLSYDELKNRLIGTDFKKKSFEIVKTFLDSHNYSIIYISPKDSVSYYVSVPANLKCKCSLDH